MSERELAVLALLPSLLSAGESADELAVYSNSVRTTSIHLPEARRLHPARRGPVGL